MKNLKKALFISFAITSLFSCSKKMQTFQFGNNPYLSHNSDVALTSSSTTLTTSTTANLDQPETINNEAVVTAKSINASKNVPEKATVEKPTFKQKIAQKILAKKIQKMEKGGGDDKMKIGIVVAAIGLLLLIFGVVLGGTIGWLLTIFGVLGLLIGLIVILLVALDMI